MNTQMQDSLSLLVSVLHISPYFSCKDKVLIISICIHPSSPFLYHFFTSSFDPSDHRFIHLSIPFCFHLTIFLFSKSFIYSNNSFSSFLAFLVMVFIYVSSWTCLWYNSNNFHSANIVYSS
jgi:hypothetical protein